MRRGLRPFLVGFATAASASAVGVAVNVATDAQGNVLAWLAVGTFTVLTGAVSGLIDNSRSPADPMADVLLSIECEVRADGTASLDVKVRDGEAERLLPHLPSLLPRGLLPAPAANGALPKPLPVALVTRNRAAGIARRLHAVGDQCAEISGLDVRVCVTDSLAGRREAIHGASVLLLDDHCHAAAGSGPLVGGLDLTDLRAADGSGLRARIVVLGCHDGATAGHTRALRRSLDRPAAFLACTGPVPVAHAPILYPHVLSQLAGLAGGQAGEAELQGALESALTLARREQPQLDWDRWATTVLHPTAG